MGRLLLAGIAVVAGLCGRDRAPAPSPTRWMAGSTQAFPVPGATGVCTDATLQLGFGGPVEVGRSGAIQVFDQDSTRVDAIDLAAPSYLDLIGGRPFKTVRPVFVDGNRVTIHLHSGVLAPGRTYFVTLDRGVLQDASGRALPAIEGRAWSFTTRRKSPADPSRLVVAADGSGDFCTVQGAIDFVPAGNTRPTTISVRRGTYREIVFITGKHALTLRGEDRNETLIAAINNDALQHELGSKFRALVGVEKVSGFVLENLTLHNQTPEGGSQAEALRVADGDRVVLRNASFLSLQDTLQLSGRVYVDNCHVEGNVDFVWGEGTAYFERSELKTVGRAGYTVQARNTNGHGYVFVDSRFTADAGVVGHWLGRIEADRFPKSHVAYIDCRIGPHVDARGWQVTPERADRAALRFQEYRSMDLQGKLLDVGGRDRVGRQLTSREAALLRDKVHVFAGWNPEET